MKNNDNESRSSERAKYRCQYHIVIAQRIEKRIYRELKIISVKYGENCAFKKM